MREAVIVDVARTAFGKRKGALANWHPTDLLGLCLREIVTRNDIDPETIDDVVGGCVTQAGEGAKNKVGPELNGLNGRKSGAAEGYSYSTANKDSGVTWGKDVFLEYIKDPKAKIPGTKMVFAGIKNENEANNLWAYVSSFDKDGKQK